MTNTSLMQPIDIKNKIILTYPGLSKYLSGLPTIEMPLPKKTSVIGSVSKIVIGQMLSRKAASCINQRAESLAVTKGKSEIALLSEEELRTCGVSSSKIKAIKLFSEQYYEDVDRYENWRNLDSTSLFVEVNKHWGLSNWSASILAIFYFGFEDVYPENDGSIKRVTGLLEQKGITFNPEKAAPYRSYLALYLWGILDQKLID